MEIRTGDPFAQEHSQYAVAVFLNESLFDQMFVLAFAKRFGVNRKAASRALAAQSVGQILTLGSRRGPTLICLVIGDKFGSASTVEVTRCLRKFSKLADAQTALITENFRFEPEQRTSTRSNIEHLELLLRRVDFSGTVYCPEGAGQYDIVIQGMEFPDERSSSTHALVRPDGLISPSIPPTMLRLKNKK